MVNKKFASLAQAKYKTQIVATAILCAFVATVLLFSFFSGVWYPPYFKWHYYALFAAGLFISSLMIAFPSVKNWSHWANKYFQSEFMYWRNVSQSLHRNLRNKKISYEGSKAALAEIWNKKIRFIAADDINLRDWEVPDNPVSIHRDIFIINDVMETVHRRTMEGFQELVTDHHLIPEGVYVSLNDWEAQVKEKTEALKKNFFNSLQDQNHSVVELAHQVMRGYYGLVADAPEVVMTTVLSKLKAAAQQADAKLAVFSEN